MFLELSEGRFLNVEKIVAVQVAYTPEDHDGAYEGWHKLLDEGQQVYVSRGKRVVFAWWGALTENNRRRFEGEDAKILSAWMDQYKYKR